MDKWSEDQVKRMQMGGNKKALEFFKSHPDYREGMTIQEKYQRYDMLVDGVRKTLGGLTTLCVFSEFARQYKEKLTAECEGRPWKAPLRSSSPRPSTLPRQNAASSPRNGSPAPGRNMSASATSFSSNSSGFGSGGGGNGGFAPDKARNEEYFAKLGNANANRSADVAPSQGGKYGGFGNPNFQSSAPDQGAANLLEDPLGALTKGWGFLASKAPGVVGVLGNTVVEGAKLAVSTAEMVGQKVTENVIQPTAAAMRDPELRNNVTGYVSTFGQKVSDIGSVGYSYAANLVDPNNAGAHGGSGGRYAPARQDAGYGSTASSAARNEEPDFWSSMGVSDGPKQQQQQQRVDEDWGSWGKGGGDDDWSTTEHSEPPKQAGGGGSGMTTSGSSSSLSNARARGSGAAAKAQGKSSDDDDEWQSF
ncbi:Zn finger-containing GTPase- Activating Protein for ARF [Borealophlyctis nickersoniae]|nr:Zn finger-containing GTPase- Activating Protein for ARF [Borealophlyctis nickersoniae]